MTNAEATGEFVCNMATYDLREAVNISSMRSEPDEDEFAATGLTKAVSQAVSVPRVAESPVHIECAYHLTMHMPGDPPSEATDIVFGRVLGVHIDDNAMTQDGRIDVLKIKPLARLGYMDYLAVEDVFEMMAPGSTEVQNRLMGQTDA